MVQARRILERRQITTLGACERKTASSRNNSPLFDTSVSCRSVTQIHSLYSRISPNSMQQINVSTNVSNPVNKAMKSSVVKKTRLTLGALLAMMLVMVSGVHADNGLLDDSYDGAVWEETWNYDLLVGDYNGDGLEDLYLKPKLTHILIYTDVSFLVPFEKNPPVMLLQDAETGYYTTITPDQTLLDSQTWAASPHLHYYGDFNNDGVADLYLQTTTATMGSAYVYGAADGVAAQLSENFGELGDLYDPDIVWEGSWPYELLSGDYDGDGLLDLYFKSKTTFVMVMMDDLLVPVPVELWPDFVLTQNDDQQTYTQVTSPDLVVLDSVAWQADNVSVFYDDFNEDNIADVLVSANAQEFPPVVLLGSADQQVVPQIDNHYIDAALEASAPNWEQGFKFNVLTGDYDCDGDQDYLLQPKSPFIMIMMDDLVIPVPSPLEEVVIQYQQVNGEPTYTEISPPDYSSCTPTWSELESDIYYGDFDGDGEADLLLASPDADHYSLVINGVSSGAPSITDQLEAILGYQVYDGVNIEIRDMDGDGKSDLVLIIDGDYEVVATATDSGTFYSSELSGQLVEGATPGQFSVTPSGTASYSIPIAVPPGTNGVTPRLSLNYDSGGGNGLVGMGWSLSAGNGAVARCGKDIATDGFVGGVNFDENDAYCLNGQRLIEVSQTTTAANVLKEYRTESESWQRVVAYGSDAANPDKWVVEDKSGENLHYGDDGSGGHAEKDANGKTIAWMMQRVEDPAKNYMEYLYTRDDSTGEHYLSQINYTANDGMNLDHYASVALVYEAREDEIRGYAFGDPSNTLKRLSRIELKYGVNTVRQYNLVYNASPTTQRSRLEAVQECDGNDNCFAPLTFEWLDGAVGINASPVATGYVPKDKANEQNAVVDIDGDGIQEVISASHEEGWKILKLDADGAWSNQSIDTGDQLGTNGARTVWGVQAMNYNGDGKDDLLVFLADQTHREEGYHWAYIYTSNGTTYTQEKFISSVYNHDNYDGYYERLTATIKAVDLDGDGLSDFIKRSELSGEVGQIRTYLNSDGISDSVVHGAVVTTSFQLEDVDSDGLVDIVDRSGVVIQWYKNTSNPGSISFDSVRTLLTTGETDCQPIFVDLNGDGLTDIYSLEKQYYYDDLVLAHFVHLNTGAGFERKVVKSENYYTDATYGFSVWTERSQCDKPITVLDWDDDGVSDILIGYLSQGNKLGLVTFEAYAELGGRNDIPETALHAEVILTPTDIVFTSGFEKGAAMVDLKGEGRPSLVTPESYGWRARFPVSGIHDGQEMVGYTDYLNKFTGSYGAETEVIYGAQINPDIYTPGAELNDSKLRAIDSGMCLVHKVKQDNGVGGYLTTQYKYHHFVTHVQGLGSFGFEKMETIDTDNEYGDAKEIDTYSHNYQDGNHTHGKLIHSQSLAANGMVLSETTNTYGHYDRSGSEGIHYAFLANSVSEAYALDDLGDENYAQVHMSTTTTDYSFDNCGSNCYEDINAGNNTGVVTTVVDHIDGTTHTKTLSNSYGIDDVSSWFLGKVTSSTATTAVSGRETQSRNSSWTYYSDTGAVKTETVEPGTADELITEYQLNSLGLNELTKVSGANIDTRSSTIQYDPLYRAPAATTNALGHTTQYAYDPVWLTKTKEISPNGIETFWTYDGFGRTTGVFRADGTYSTTERQGCGGLLGNVEAGSNCSSVVTQYNAGGTTTQIEKDRLGRTLRTLTESLDGQVVLSENLYDNLGRTIGTSTPYFDGQAPLWTTSSHYDLLGRPTEVVNPEGNTSSVIYNATTTLSINEVGQRKTVFNNGVGEMTQVQDSTGWPIYYTYDAFGKLLTTTDGDGVQVARLEYDQRGNKTLMVDADKGTWTYDYNVLGQLVLQADAEGNQTCNVYDILGRVTKRVDQYQGSANDAYNQCGGDDNNPKTTLWYYDTAPVAGLGKPHLSVGENGYFQIASYDSLGRPVNNIELIGGQYYTVATTYDSLGRVDTTEYPNGFTVRNGYNSLSFLDEISNADTGQSYWHIDSEAGTMNARGQILDQTFGQGISQTNTYNDASGLISAIQANNGVNTVADLSFEFDAIGNLTKKSDLAQGIREEYSYIEAGESQNHLNRLSKATAYLNGETVEQSVTYCANGNIKTKSDVGTYNYGNLANNCSNATGPHAINSITGLVPSTFSYDANGNMITGNDKVVQYSAFGKPEKIIRGSTEIEFQYGPGRQLIQRIDQHNGSRTEKTMVGGLYEKVDTLNKTTHKYYVGGFLVVSQEDNSSLLDEAYLFKDHLGSVVAITDANGVVKERMAYDPWGKRRNPDWQAMLDAEVYNFQSNVTQKGFTGHEMLDPVGLVHMGGRVYDPVIGRFLSADPFVNDATNTQALNRYSYVENNPLSYTDPSGFFLSKLKKKFKKLRGKIRRAVKRAYHNTVGALGRELKRAMIKHEWLGQVLQIGVCAVSSPLGCAAFAGAMTWGMTGDFQAGLMAFATSAIMPSAGGFGDDFILRAVQAGVMSGAIAVAQGGNFKDAFKASIVGSLAGGVTGGINSNLKIDNAYLGTAVAALVGGTVAKLTGGDFANGARSAAFSYIITHKGEFFTKKKAAAASEPKTISKPGCTCKCSGANPIIFSTGTKFLVMTDYQSATKANGKGSLKLVRYYTSDATQHTGFGLGWRSNFDRSLKFSGEGASSVAITAYRDNAQTRVFYSIEAGQWQAPNGEVEQLIQLQPNESEEGADQAAWQLITADNSVESYDATGRLIRITELGGYTQTLRYGSDAGAEDVLLSVTDSYGQHIEFDYNYGGLIQAVQTPQGETRYQYDDHLNLVKVTDPDQTQTWGDNPYKQYHYDDIRFANAITSITDSEGRTIHRMAYEDHGYATLSTLGDDMEHYTVAYNDDGSRTHTNALGRQTTYFFDDHDRPIKVEGHATASCVGANKAYEYDDNGFLASKTDWNDIETRFQYNDRGLMVSQTQAFATPEAYTIEQQWHDEFRLPTRIITPGNTTEFTYNSQGLLIEKTIRDTSDIAADNANPVINSLRQWVGIDTNTRTFTYTYNDQGQLASIDGPRTDVDDRSEFQYNPQGNRISATNALGDTSQILAHNPQGLPTLIEDQNGLQTQLAYNPQGWLIRKTVDQATTTYQYDPVANYQGTGRVTQITAPDGSWIKSHYNQGGKVIALENNLGESQHYELDRQGNPIQHNSFDEQHQLTQTYARQYDALSRLTAQIGAHQQTVSYQYDPNDNLVSQTDGLGNVTDYQYDNLNRLVATVDANQNTAQQGYDAMGNLTQVIDPRGIVTDYHYNGFGELLQLQSADTGSTVNQYDSAGNRIESVDARGVVSQMHYDALNRLTAIDYPGSPDQNITYQYQNGRLANVQDASGSQQYRYDPSGRVTEQQHQIEGQTYQVHYQYNAAGQLIRATYPSGRVIHYQYDLLGRLSGMEQQSSPQATPEILVDQISYQPFGPRKGLRFGNGIEQQQQLDLDYRIGTIHHFVAAANDDSNEGRASDLDSESDLAIVHRQYQYNANNNIVAIDNLIASESSQQFQYDPLNRLTQAQGSYGSLGYEYDAVGNRLSKTTAAEGLSQSESYQYAQASNRLLAVQQTGGDELPQARQLSYTANGNIQQDSSAEKDRRLVYNARNRLVEITQAGQTTALYSHNAQGQRVIKAVGERGQHFIYNQFDQLIAEANDQGVIEKEYVYLGNTAIAHIEAANDAVYYYHNDHLGTAQVITDAMRNVVWAVDYTPFGGVESGIEIVENNWRFPGQYEDGESGYYYNYFRDYDPTLGRYLESDPIGLGGGFNTFGYVLGNPGSVSDYYGLSGAFCPLPGQMDFGMELAAQEFSEQAQNFIDVSVALATDYTKAAGVFFGGLIGLESMAMMSAAGDALGVGNIALNYARTGDEQGLGRDVGVFLGGKATGQKIPGTPVGSAVNSAMWNVVTSKTVELWNIGNHKD